MWPSPYMKAVQTWQFSEAPICAACPRSKLWCRLNCFCYLHMKEIREMAHKGQVVRHKHKRFCSRILFLSRVPLVPGGELGLRASLWATKTNSTATWQTAGMPFLHTKGFQTRRGGLPSLSKIDTGDTELLMPNLTWLQEEGVRFHEVTKSTGEAFWRHFDCSPPFQEWSTWEHT